MRMLAALVLALATPLVSYAAESIDTLARDVDRVESLRQVKDVQRAYAHFAQAGQWNRMAGLFTRDARFIHGDDRVNGSAAIGRWLTARGGGRQGLPAGALNFEFIDAPLANLSADGLSAKVRWYALTLAGDGKGAAPMLGGLYENEYVRDGASWKISVSHFFPQYSGDYATAWANHRNEDLPLIPFHFTLDESGIPLPPATGAAPKSPTSLEQLEARITALNDEDAVRNLQHAYGYYVDRKMWDDVVDLFAADAVVDIAGVGTFRGKDGVRKAMERMGPAGLAHGQLNDWPIFDTIVRVQPGGSEAFARGFELGMLGEADRGTAEWSFTVFRNRFVKEGGLWKLRELRVTPFVRADYAVGWGKGGHTPPTNRSVPEFLPVAGTVANKAVAAKGSSDERLADARRRLARSQAWDGTENISSAYGYYIDDFQWPEMAGTFAGKGNKQSPFAGYYIGRDRILGAVNANYGPAKGPRSNIAFHWRTQPVILVSADGRSSNLRTRLFHPDTAKRRPDGTAPGSDIMSGMYPNDQAVLENGIWRLWTLEIDEPYFTMAGWKGGWSGVKPVGGERSAPPPSRLLSKYPPDILMTELGKRADGFRGGTGTTVEWPGILPMWFNYRNPVSGREPPLYLPDCVPCELRPESQMTRHGYQMPPTGP